MHDGGGLTDGQLLECFLREREEAAFEALLRRHGPMVLGVCRRMLPNAHDAEDAFQATFLVLVRKAHSVVPREMVGHWLHGVAFRTALEARAAAAKRRAKERRVRLLPKPDALERDGWQELRPLLDQELQRLPDKYRAAVVLCDLEGRTRKEAAGQLGLPEGTLSSRLAAARKLLGRRLARRGLALTAAAAPACAPDALIAATVRAAVLCGAGGPAAGVVSVNAAALIERVLKTTVIARRKLAAVLFLALGVVAAGAGLVPGPRPPPNPEASEKVRLEPTPAEVPAFAAEEARPEGQPRKKEQEDDDDEDRKDQAVVRAVDTSANTLTVVVTRKGKNVEQTFGLPENVRVSLAGKGTGLKDLKPGTRVSLKMSEDKKSVLRIKEVKGPQDKGGARKNGTDEK